MSDESEVEATIAECVARFGQLDVLVNVAAILRSDRLHELATADWQRVLAVNLTGTFFMYAALVLLAITLVVNIVGTTIVQRADAALKGLR